MSSAPQQVDGGELKRVNSYQWPSGHVGHLSEGQQSALLKFKTLCQEKGYFHPGDDQTPPSHDDETMLRYLRARKFVPKDAFGQFQSTEDWRQENQIESLYETIDVDEYEQTRRLYPQWTGRRDRRGIPFYVYEVANIKAKDVAAYQNDSDRSKDDKTPPITSKVPRKMLRLFALYESLCRFVLPLCSAIPNRPNPETPVSQSSNIVDISKVGFKQFWNLRAHLQDSSRLATAHYPETLDRIFVVGAPSFFPTIFNWAKGWFDPITVQKILILEPKTMLEQLTKYVDIENIPKKYGGNLDWQFGDMPMLEPDIANALRWKEDIRLKEHRSLPIGPIKWQYDADGDLMAVETGTKAGTARSRALGGLHPEDGVARLALSPGRNELNHSTLLATASGAGATTAARTASQSAASTANGAVTKPRMSGEADLDIGKTEGSISAPESRVGTYTVPYQDPENEIQSPPEDSRQGTSSTRYEQQVGTHAEGQLAHGTPETRVDGQGVEHSIMEPRTVGQAPKEIPLHREDDRAPTIIEQAQQAAGQALETAKQVPAMAMSAVGLVGPKVEENVEEQTKAEDPRVDDMNQAQMEEFLRTKSKSQPEPLK